MDDKTAKLILDLVLTIVGSGLLGASMMMFVKKKGGPVAATLALIVGLTLVQQWGTPDLLDRIITKWL